MKKVKKLLALILALAMVFALASCGGSTGTNSGSGDETPLVVGYLPFSSKFSPFFAQSSYDQDVANMTQLQLLTNDRTGAIIYNGIEGETHEYNGTEYTYTGPADLKVTENSDGTVFYDFTLRDDLKFSDGTPVTIDDVIFSYYVLLDPTYDGSITLYSMPIEGLDAYRSGMEPLFELLIKAGRDNTDFTFWTEEQQTAFWADLDQAGAAFCQEIVDYVVEAGAVEDATDIPAAAEAWGIEGLAAGATTTDMFYALAEKYNWDLATVSTTESAGTALFDLMEDYDAYTIGVETGNSAPNVSGIQKTGDYSMRVVATEVDATMIYQLGGAIAPMHYYGDADLYDYENNQFGFPKGDLSSVREKIANPMGAGPYKFLKFENGVINFEANDNYYKGTPATKYVNFQQMDDKDKLNSLITGTLDIADPTFSQDTVKAIEEANGGELNGKVVTSATSDFLGYGYIGMNANKVCVANDPGSDASKALRKAFGTIFSVYRDVAIDTYYGERASVINYPISNTSWAAPRPTDEGYKVAFSVDAAGNDIYTSSMDADARYAAAKEAALSFFEKAGYTVSDGKVTAAPEGAKMEYEVLIPADGSGDHPTFMVLTLASEALKELGINLIVTDLADSNQLWNGLDAGTVEMWCAAWGATVDPDMYQIYYADVANGGANAGGDSDRYCIADPELDDMIMTARKSTDQNYRKALYKACLDTIIDWACEIPVYQRQEVIVYSTERVNLDTVTPDITPFYKWNAEIENIELN